MMIMGALKRRGLYKSFGNWGVTLMANINGQLLFMTRLSIPTQSHRPTLLNQSTNTFYLSSLGVPYQVTDANSWKTVTTYDGLGRTLSVTPPGLAAGQAGMVYQYAQPNNGQVKYALCDRDADIRSVLWFARLLSIDLGHLRWPSQFCKTRSTMPTKVKC